MRVIPATTFKRSVWRNGGGITHEIARNGNGDDFGWRISVAEVSSDGPFSLFPGYQRCLTVISGNGMELQGTVGSIDAPLHKPVWFSGSEAINGRLVNGPCLDFNVIFDPGRFHASVEILSGPASGIHGETGIFTAFYRLAALPFPGDLTILELPSDEVNLEEGAKAILLRLSAHKL
jgi:uncharacterized protein